MDAEHYQEQIQAAADWVAWQRVRLRQAPAGLKPHRQQELDEARRYLRDLQRHPSAGLAPAPVDSGPRCHCGARLLTTKNGQVCAAGTHDD